MRIATAWLDGSFCAVQGMSPAKALASCLAHKTGAGLGGPVYFLPTLRMKLQPGIFPFPENAVRHAIRQYHGISPGFFVHYQYLEY